jgi:hypothetical protein
MEKLAEEFPDLDVLTLWWLRRLRELSGRPDHPASQTAGQRAMNVVSATARPLASSQRAPNFLPAL